MCGIAALVHHARRESADAEIRRMLAAAGHRGPDGEGVTRFEASGSSVTLGHRRLAILDRGDTGHQPMSCADDRFCITFNGEIYNYLELGAELRSLGHRFRGSSDTEVLLAAYAQWGTQCLERLNGMWAFVIWDGRERTLFAARDRFGVKPLHYAMDGNRVGVASEIKQLLAAGFGNSRADRDSVAQFLVYGDVNIGSDTCFAGIRQPCGGSFLWRVDDGSDAICPRTWYDLGARSIEPPEDRAAPEPAALALRTHLEQSVRLRMRSDVEVGSCLSGGLDSSSIVALAMRASGSGIRTFTARFPDTRVDEWAFARQVAGHLGARAHSIVPDMDRLLTDLPELTWHQEEPFRSSGIYAQWNVMRLAREHGIKVLLDGQGADEILLGYHWWIPVHIAHLVRRGRPVQALRSIRELHATGILASTEGAARMIAKSAYRLFSGGQPPSGAARLLHDGLVSPHRVAATTDLRARALQEIRGSLQSLLRHEDRNSMAFGIEARTPFLDYRLVEWAMAQDSSTLFRGGWTKAPLRDAMQDTLPENVIRRVDKRGFSTPEPDWLRRHRDQVRSRLFDGDFVLTPWVDRARLLAWFDRTRDHALVWRWLSTSEWMRRFGLS